VRESDLSALRDKLATEQATVGIIGVRGMGGIGKTVIATALARDEVIRAKFPYGVVWLTFGRDAPPLTKAAELAATITRRTTRFGSVDAARGQLGELTRERALLVILDDVWEPEAADPFTVLGPACRVLVTTRDVRVLTRMRANRHDVGLFKSAAAREFLASASGLSDVRVLPPEVDAIIRHCGYLPLALAAVGALIQTGTYSWADALQALEEGATQEFDTSWLSDPAQRNIAIVLRISVESLSPVAHSCFLACTAFRDDADIPEAALLRRWSDIVANHRLAKRMADELEGRSLLIRYEPDAPKVISAVSSNTNEQLATGIATGQEEGRRYRIHDLYVDYLRHAASPLAEQHANLLACYRRTCPSGWDTCPDDGYIIRHLPWHMREAGQAAEMRDLLFQFGWLQHKLKHTNVNALISDYTLLPDDQEAATLAAALSLSANALFSDKGQLACQLQGRLVPASGPTIARVLDGIRSLSGFAPERVPYLKPPNAALRCFGAHTDSINSVAALPDGHRALSASSDETLRLWDIETGTELRCLLGHTGSVNSVSLLKEGRRALSASADATLRLWDIETGAELRLFEGHTASVNSVTVLPDGRRALSASDDATLRLWNIETGAALRLFEGHTAAVNSVTVLPDGRRVLSASDDTTLRLWDIETGAEVRRFTGHRGPVTSVAMLLDGRALSGSWDQTLRLWNVETGVELCHVKRHASEVKSMAVLPDGRHVLTGSDNAALQLWDIEARVELWRFAEHTGSINSIVILPDGRRALSGSDDGTVRLWDTATAADRQLVDGHGGAITSIALLPDGRCALSASFDETLRIWDVKNGARLWRYKVHEAAVTAISILPDGRRALTACNDATLRLWDIDTGVELQRIRGHRGSVSSVAVLPDGRRVLSCSHDHTLRLWDIETGVELRRFEGHTSLVSSVAVLPDGRRALSASWDETLRLWDIETGAQLQCINERGNKLVVALPDGHRALSATLGVWDIETGIELRPGGGHHAWGGQRSLAIAALPDGRRALSASWDHNALWLWDIETKTELDCYVGDASFTALAPMPDGHHVLTGNALGQVVLFRLPA
jgi:WD40 repeat protein